MKTKKKRATAPMEDVLEAATGKKARRHKKLAISDCEPNTWNPNRMNEATRAKLMAGLSLVEGQADAIPPIIVRPLANEPGRYQIIDGFHRWDIYRQLGRDSIDAFILDVDTKTAMVLTDTLNYLRGEPDPDEYVKYYQKLLTENKMTPAEASLLLPETETEIQDMLDAHNIRLDYIEIPDESEGEASADDDGDSTFLEVKFLVSRTQQEIIEQEIARIGSMLEGKNVRGRVLEFMAVNSSQTPLESMIGLPGEAESSELDEDPESSENLEGVPIQTFPRKKRKKRKKE